VSNPHCFPATVWFIVKQLKMKVPFWEVSSLSGHICN